ncbi:hypothetical protein FVE85_9328 [Porphyridium purpureum]|uniref:Uncharacterized protein n=1 Tax=Porphyridium purpureum TaxID=35688 RepID=A0A5J4YP15_PORPP|nr:hypothetical protein FVE85_9328 [Porphyridium purpureum]|eukprot:POR3097..scf222_8
MAMRVANACKSAANHFLKGYVVKGTTPEALAETQELGKKLVATTMDAAPARVIAAKAEFNAMKEKVMKLDVSVEEAKVGLMGLLQVMGFFYLGKILGSGRMQDL